MEEQTKVRRGCRVASLLASFALAGVTALGLDFALTDNLDAMLPYFPTRFAGEK